MRLLVVGSVAYDSVETAYGKVDRALGGSATFFAMASSLLAPTHVVAVVGEDFRPSDMERLNQRGVDTSGIEIVPGETFRWGGIYSKHFETRTTLFTELNVFSDFSPRVPQKHRSAELVFLANIHPALQYQVLDQVDKPKFVALDTMNFWISGEREALVKVLGRIDALFLNDEEAYALSGIGNLLLAAREIQKMGPKTVVIKRGEHGAVLFHGDTIRHTPALLLDTVRDPTGAGDTFAGGFMGYLATQPEINVAALEGAMVMGTLAASVSVEDFSVDALERADLKSILTRQKALRQLSLRVELDEAALLAKR